MYFPKLPFKSVRRFVLFFLNKVVFCRKTTTETCLDKTGGMFQSMETL